ncbi:MAG: cell envelope integrity EipB family protein [Hyphomicrobiaceae bacterium]
MPCSTISSYLTVACVCLSSVLTVPTARAQAAQKGVEFAPHRAVYDITLKYAAGGSSIADITGRMVYELVGSRCDGYTQNMRYATRMTTNRGKVQINDLVTSTWEDGKGDRLRFNTTQFRDSRLVKATQGDAERSIKTAGIEVKLIKPSTRKIALKQGTYFPIQHATELIRSARAGRARFEAKLYDGSDEGVKVYDTNSVIGRIYKPGEKPIVGDPKQVAPLQKLASWPVSIGYFEPDSGKTDAVPAYELSFRYFDNGVTTKLLIDYGNYAISGNLAELTFLERGECAAK